MSRIIQALPMCILTFVLTGAAASLIPTADRADFALTSVENATAVLNEAIAFMGGPERVDALTADYEEAVRAGVALSEAGLSDAQMREFAAQGSNVIVDCGGPAGHPDIAKMNAVLVPAGGDAILCGAHNPDLDVPAFAASENAEGCSPVQGLLAETMIAVGGNDWVCNS
jgi:hypothetical protein